MHLRQAGAGRLLLCREKRKELDYVRWDYHRSPCSFLFLDGGKG